ncbi:hypothetical protein POM88_005684 [Heracleum sosnowskyi]|uniref:RNase H type-1 domain-containing protein n=1 Tax=Heracleum sosnowskyi TaxID=360622 RepID=A0AAD8N4N3_9APIA|nr:hypothetical protein POM88_005684 [Heracleum sosnowskyi]
MACANYAEAAAASFGVQVAKQLGYRKVVLETDAMNEVSDLKYEKAGLSPLFLFYEDIHMLKRSLDSFQVRHVKRGGNTVAHLAARWDVSFSSDFFCTDLIPQSNMTLAEFDSVE